MGTTKGAQNPFLLILLFIFVSWSCEAYPATMSPNYLLATNQERKPDYYRSGPINEVDDGYNPYQFGRGQVDNMFEHKYYQIGSARSNGTPDYLEECGSMRLPEYMMESNRKAAEGKEKPKQTSILIDLGDDDILGELSNGNKKKKEKPMARAAEAKTQDANPNDVTQLWGVMKIGDGMKKQQVRKKHKKIKSPSRRVQKPAEKTMSILGSMLPTYARPTYREQMQDRYKTSVAIPTNNND